MKYRIGIVGYGNLGRGAEKAVAVQPDMTLEAVFTRRQPSEVRTESGAPVYSCADLPGFKSKLDVLILCGGSATDLPQQTSVYAKDFNVVDSFDTHARIPEHFETVDAAARSGVKVAVISTGWDPGLFSLQRLLAGAVLVNGSDYTFWGRGVSQGHSDAIRRIPGVRDARQYTVPLQEALEAVRSGGQPQLSTRQKHRRECYVVLEDGADAAAVEQQIKTMPNYFADYDTTVHFIDEETLKREHASLAHGGFVFRSGTSGTGEGLHRHVIEYSLKLDSNPEFTGLVLVAYARAAARLSAAGERGCRTVFDIAPALLSPLPAEKLRSTLL